MDRFDENFKRIDNRPEFQLLRDTPEEAAYFEQIMEEQESEMEDV